MAAESRALCCGNEKEIAPSRKSAPNCDKFILEHAKALIKETLIRQYYKNCLIIQY